MTYDEAVKAVKSYWNASLCANASAERYMMEAVDVLEKRAWERIPEEEKDAAKTQRK